MGIETLVTFAAVFLVFAASPGPDNMAVMARTVSVGPASGMAYGAGTVTGILFFLALSAFGLSYLAQKFGFLMMMLRYGGAAYLAWMGWRMWHAAPVVPEHFSAGDRRGLTSVFATGVAMNLGNPKMPLFYLALLPGFVGNHLTFRRVFALAVTILLVEILVIGGHVMLALRVRRLLRDPGAVRTANRIAGGSMMGAGVAVVGLR